MICSYLISISLLYLTTRCLCPTPLVVPSFSLTSYVLVFRITYDLHLPKPCPLLPDTLFLFDRALCDGVSHPLSQTAELCHVASADRPSSPSSSVARFLFSPVLSVSRSFSVFGLPRLHSLSLPSLCVSVSLSCPVLTQIFAIL